MNKETIQDIRHNLKSLLLQAKLNLRKALNAANAIQSSGSTTGVLSVSTRDKLYRKVVYYIGLVEDNLSALDEVIEVDICGDSITEGEVDQHNG